MAAEAVERLPDTGRFHRLSDAVSDKRVENAEGCGENPSFSQDRRVRSRFLIPGLYCFVRFPTTALPLIDI
jgi:hypothetical protein